MSLDMMVRALQAGLISIEVAHLVMLSAYSWSGIGSAPWLSRRFRRLVGTADIRSVPIDWSGIVLRLRRRGWTGKLPRSLRKYEPGPEITWHELGDSA